MSPNNLNNERELLRKIAEGDEEAFRSLFHQYRIPLFSFSLEMTKSAGDAEDMVQEIFIKIWQNRERLAKLDYAKPYIYAMARNHVFDFLHKVARNEQMAQQLWANVHIDTVTAEDFLQVKESQQLINEAVALLPPAKQQVFRLSRYSGLNHEQIALQMGLSRSRVKNILVETLKFIKDYLVRYSVYIFFFSWSH